MTLSIRALSGLKVPTAADFDQHTDFHTIASFFIGWVFVISLSCITSSPAASSLARAVFYQRTPRWFHDSRTNSIKASSDVESDGSSISPSKRDSRTLLLIMFLAFATGSLANFASLLTFEANSGLCDFVVAWSELSFMTARLMGLLVLLFDLRQRGIARWESIALVVWLVIGLAFIFFNSAVATGITISPTASSPVFFCYRKHFLPASLVTSVLYILLEIIVLARFWALLRNESPLGDRGLKYLLDLRILRTLSLLLLDGLTVVPSAIVTNILGEFIPLSIGSVAVLTAFAATRGDDTPIPRSISSPFNFTSIIAPSLPERLPTHQIRSPPLGVPPVILMNHPYSAVLLKDPEGFFDSPRSARSDGISPPTDRSFKHQPNNSLGLTIEVSSQPVNEPPLSTGKSESYPASVLSSRVVKATRLKRQRSAEHVRPKLFIMTTPALRRKSSSSSRYDQSTLEISPPLRSRFSLATTVKSGSDSPSSVSYPLPAVAVPNKSESGSTISYPNPVVVDPQTLSPYSNRESNPQATSGSDSDFESLQLGNAGYSDVIQARLSKRMSGERGHRPLPRIP
ncbi:hypothetical protein K435DRAFT_13376 [Dendrothele bispora CBS 962.96]|uniref:Uncharacterized protein n=1 Tax=Dendrothele bispora (strain CBS 962.96) TaxID=1314807 RepID=A0A4S8MYH8_DENBC|nr:hypothetical protein K435DRAFT_13376 [Dendrothele bispora CBS 962.96]